MCAPARLLRQLFCLVVLAVSRTAGVVTASKNLTVTVGESLNLSCSISTSTGHSIHQVHWLNRHKQTLLAYKPSSPVQISHQDQSVLLTSSQHGASHITIKTVKPEDDGCFFCIFDVYPTGPQEGKTCVTVKGKVNHKPNTTAIAGKPTTLTCSYTLPAKVAQVLWAKTDKHGRKSTVASFSKSGSKVEEMFSNRLTLNKNMSQSELSIKEVKMEDEACYSCEFHTYPDGPKSAMTCLQVYVLPKPVVNYVTLSPDTIEANCSAQSKPSAQIMWDFGGDRTLGSPVFFSFNQSDGTTTVTSTVLFKSAALSDVKCILHHPGLDKPLLVSLTNAGPAMIVLLTVCGVAVVLLLCLCGCLCKCFVCNDD
ncbi:hypothetical protein WMY93_022457 [Mugilogobius chulae]|uniref:Ig-like domain-containing protein n=1 Tax=Mugilogobius chulae TaxID=88201 RepID=A0AAW0NHM5_9GOBI